jgi:protein-tyrosine phosphatase
LHADCSPTALSTYEEPVWQVIHDMREQRMSLCQSLRQYVFVHAALIEGALMIVDEERGVSEKGSTLGSGSSTISAGTRPSPGISTNAGSQSNLTPSVGKRGASPTELLKKDKKGQLSLAKRPSMKRKQSSTDGRGVTFNVAATESLPSGSGAAALW